MVPYFDCREEGEGVESRKHQHTLILPVSSLFETIGDYMTSPSWFSILLNLHPLVPISVCFSKPLLLLSDFMVFFSPISTGLLNSSL